MSPYPWQHSQWRQLQERLVARTLPQALLLVGQEGLGKDAFARELAKAALCRSPDGGSPCGRCQACLLFEAGTHPDFRWVVPEEEGKAIKVDQIRPLAEFVGLSRHHGDHKVAVITPAQAMNLNAANSLLKTLEEPTSGTLLILVADRPGLLPATVRSRCQQLKFSAPPREDALDWLKSQGLPADKVEAALGMAQGAPLRAMVLMDPESLAARSAFLADLKRLVARRAGVVELAERWKAAEFATLIDWQLSWIQDLIRIASVSKCELVRNRDLYEDLRALAQTIDLKALLRAYDGLLGHRRLLGVPLNAELRLEESLLIWAELTTERGSTV